MYTITVYRYLVIMVKYYLYCYTWYVVVRLFPSSDFADWCFSLRTFVFSLYPPFSPSTVFMVLDSDFLFKPPFFVSGIRRGREEGKRVCFFSRREGGGGCQMCQETCPSRV